MAATGKTRGKYLGFVAHEIKNPLATALWSCDLLKRMEGVDRQGERAEKMIDVSLRALRRMRRLIDDYFTIERLLENGYELRREKVAMRELVETTMQLLKDKDAISTEGWTLEMQPIDVMGDGDMLRKCVRALLEYMARGGPKTDKPKLSISARPTETGWSALLVRAEVPPAPVLPPEPEDRPSGDPTGAVLGYALAARIVEIHGGRLEEVEGGILLSLPPG